MLLCRPLVYGHSEVAIRRMSTSTSRCGKNNAGAGYKTSRTGLQGLHKQPYYIKRLKLNKHFTREATVMENLADGGSHKRVNEPLPAGYKGLVEIAKSLYKEDQKTESIEELIRRLRQYADIHEQRIMSKRPRTGHYQNSIPAAYYRGGTSRAIIFQDSVLPQEERLRNNMFLQAIGSPDPHGRQLNGMGAGVSSLSKICIVKPRPKGDSLADVDYTFVGMGIERDEVDFAGNCGNMSAAVGPYAFNEHILPNMNKTDYETCTEATVRVLNTNTGVVIHSKFTIEQGQAKVDDSTSIDGVSGLGTGVLLDFVRPGGSKTGKLLPTGNAVDTIQGFEVSCIDAANPCVFVRASDLDVDPTILPEQFLAKPDKLQKLEELRSEAAIRMGLCKPGETPPRVIPKIAIVSPPVSQRVLSGEEIPVDALDLVVRFVSDAQPHRAIPLTGALCTATAAKVPGSVAQQCIRQIPVEEGLITIGHSSGRIQVNATMDEKGDVESASVVRTARRLMEGRVYWNHPAET